MHEHDVSPDAATERRADTPPAARAAGPQHILALQRTAGNAVVTRWLQRMPLLPPGGMPQPKVPEAGPPQQPPGAEDAELVPVRVGTLPLFDQVPLDGGHWSAAAKAPLMEPIVVSVPPIGAVQIGARVEGAVATTLDTSVGPGEVQDVVLHVERSMLDVLEVLVSPLAAFRDHRYEGSGRLAVPAALEIRTSLDGSVAGEVQPLASPAEGRLRGGIQVRGAASELTEFAAPINLSYQGGELSCSGEVEAGFSFQLQLDVTADAEAVIRMVEAAKGGDAGGPAGLELGDADDSPFPSIPGLPGPISGPAPVPALPGAPPRLPVGEIAGWRRRWKLGAWQWSRVLDGRGRLHLSVRDGKLEASSATFDEIAVPPAELLAAIGEQHLPDSMRAAEESGGGGGGGEGPRRVRAEQLDSVTTLQGNDCRVVFNGLVDLGDRIAMVQWGHATLPGRWEPAINGRLPDQTRPPAITLVSTNVDAEGETIDVLPPPGTTFAKWSADRIRDIYADPNFFASAPEGWLIDLDLDNLQSFKDRYVAALKARKVTRLDGTDRWAAAGEAVGKTGFARMMRMNKYGNFRVDFLGKDEPVKDGDAVFEVPSQIKVWAGKS